MLLLLNKFLTAQFITASAETKVLAAYENLRKIYCVSVHLYPSVLVEQKEALSEYVSICKLRFVSTKKGYKRDNYCLVSIYRHKFT